MAAAYFVGDTKLGLKASLCDEWRMPSSHSFFATSARGLDTIVAAELTALGATDVLPGRGGVHFTGSLETGYLACLWSRTASRILLELGRGPAADGDQLYETVRTIRWADQLPLQRTIAVDYTQVKSQLQHTQFGALRTKDAVCDQLREARGERPDVDTARPDLLIHVHVETDVAAVSVDLAGESLHRRGYRVDGAEAPLKETLAAAILLLLDWPARAELGQPLLDPMCGSGTLCIEAALMATQRAPGLNRTLPRGWTGQDPALWTRLVAEAKAKIRPLKNSIVGLDHDPRAVAAANANARRALPDAIVFRQQELEVLEAPAGIPGLLVTNPPYDERLGADPGLYPLLGDLCKRRFPGWTVGVLSGTPELAGQLGLRPKRRHPLWNGPIECRLVELPIGTEAPVSGDGPGWRKTSAHSEMFGNRLRKNYKHIAKWAKREGVSCYRLYDKDLPEYAVAVDLYEDWVQVQEYAPPSDIDENAAARRLRDVMARVPEALEIPAERVFLKVRRRQRPDTQYGRQAEGGDEKIVREGDAKLYINLTDYLDTGLYLDERPVRKLVRELAVGKDFLNLFSYTGAATIQAALGGARSSLSVDLSNTYLAWSERNFELNKLARDRHRLERADVLGWLGTTHGRWDVIFLAPPTFSNSAKMEEDLDVQRDHLALIRGAAKLMRPGGTIVFSTHSRRFRLDRAELTAAGLSVTDVSQKTIPTDFARDARVHQCFRIERTA